MAFYIFHEDNIKNFLNGLLIIILKTPVNKILLL